MKIVIEQKYEKKKMSIDVKSDKFMFGINRYRPI